MRPDRYSYDYSHLPAAAGLRRMVWRGIPIVLALVLLVMTRADSPWLQNGRRLALDVLAPVMEVAAFPARMYRNALESKAAFFATYDENKRLHDENDRLRHWQSIAMALKAENEALRGLAAYKPVGGVRYVGARVLTQSPLALGGSLTIDVGANQGIAPLQPVMDAHGLVGRIVEVSAQSARVMLLSDSTSHVPVVTGISRAKAILDGTGEALLRLSFVDGDVSAIQLGEPVLTTQEGGLIEGSILVGTVFRKEGTVLLVKPARALTESDYVQVMVRE